MMEYFSMFLSLALMSHSVFGYLIIMEGQCSPGQENCCIGQEMQHDSILKKRIDSLEAQVTQLQETIERHINYSVSKVCQDDFTRYNDSCYYIAKDKGVSFIEAERFCRLLHNSHLIHVQSEEENNFIKDILRKTSAGNFWIGLTDMNAEGEWIWYGTRQKPNFTGWHPVEPSGAVVENCAVYAYHSDFLWNDYPCTDALHPICEMQLL